MIRVKLLKETLTPEDMRNTESIQWRNGKTNQTVNEAPYKIDDMAAIKIDRVDKTSPVHPNMLLHKIMEIRKDYAKIITPQGSIKIICLRFEECVAKKFRLELLASKQAC